MNNRGPALPGSVMSGLLMVLVVAAGARVAYELLAPLVPTLIVLALLIGVFTVIFRR